MAEATGPWAGWLLQFNGVRLLRPVVRLVGGVCSVVRLIGGVWRLRRNASGGGPPFV